MLKLVYTVTLVIALMGGTQLAHVYGQPYITNEGSYKYGYEYGKQEWSSCTYPADKYGNTEDCTPGGDIGSNDIVGSVYNSTIGEHMQVSLGHVGNFTACMHGYIHAWNHVCDPIEAKKADLGYGCPTTMRDQIN